MKLKGQIPSCVNSLKRLNDMEQVRGALQASLL